jgi:NAD+ kinase
MAPAAAKPTQKPSSGRGALKFRRVALVGKLRSPEIAASLKELREFLDKRGCEVLIESETAAGLGAKGSDYEAIGKGADLAIVVGGDGTMLAAARNLVRYRVPVTGVNQGRVGFMTDIGHDDMQAGVGAILDGKYSLEERALLDAEILRGNKTILRTIALNEAVVGKGAQGRLIEFNLSIDGEFIYTLRADGVIVATPTGSTAYALSAQGPILHPAVPALALVPLNPHTLSARPVSVSDRSQIEILLVRALDARAHFDGFALTDMAEGDRLLLKRSADAVRFVHPPGYRYFATLREKLRWSEVLDKTRDLE